MTIPLTDQDDGREVRAGVGDVLDVRLSENATTGYRWELDTLDPQRFELAGATGEYTSAVPGSGGTAQFQIKVLAAGKGTIRLKYWRQWEGEAGVVKRFSVQVDAS